MAELTRQLADVVTILERSTPRVDPDDGPSA
jgi:hypothetical protein